MLISGCLITLALTATTLHSRAERPRATPDPAHNQSPDTVWRDLDSESKTAAQAQQQRPGIRSFRNLVLDEALLRNTLRAAPMEFSEAATRKPVTLTLPNPDGTFARFSIAESPIMAPELAARFPEIKTYSAQGLDDPAATTRFDWTPNGFHGIILSEKGTVLIEPSEMGDTQHYIVYFQKEVVAGSGECDVTQEEQEQAIARTQSNKRSAGLNPAVTSGTTLRTYRLAAAATAEYTQAYGSGTVNGALAAITTTINLVNAIYERDVAIRLTLIAGETSIIFTDTTTDGYTTDNVSSLIGENQTKLTSVIGAANYDVGHVFDGRLLSGGFFSWQGLASLGVVCNDGLKARGVDIFRSVFPTSLYAYYSAAHELGHQFNASHTFNATSGTCGGQRIAGTAYEPLNGSTIMAYRLACAPEDLNSQDTYFHNASIEQIVNYTNNGNGNSCAVLSATGNNLPAVNAGANYTVPMGTPFTLTATGSDPDGDALTFGWEEFDLGTAAPPSTDDGSRPIFRSFLPTTSPSRTFPRLADILTGSPTLGESLPVTTRTMNFRVTARDNRAGGGGVNSAATTVSVRADAGPFTVTQPASGATWPTGSNQTVSWNVAGTNSGLVNCANVRITLSTNGVSFPIVLAENTPNDGSETVTIPGTPSGSARIKVEGAGNIFFNISPGFTITGSTNTVPTINGFAPTSGLVGDSITINGTNFITPSEVRFNGTGASFTLNSTTQIVATVPSGATTGPISVTTTDGTANSSSSFVVNSLAPSFVQFSAVSYLVNEGTADVNVTVNRTGDTSTAANVTYATSDIAGANNCNVFNNVASSRCDYLTTLGTLRFAAGETSKTISLPIVDDAYAEGSESFTITLANPSGATLGSPATATITITDNDSSTGTNPIDTAGFFVRQHYIDFLNREPDPGGLAFWTDQITSCGANAPCVEVKRINVSAAFYLSIEFQDTGYLVERLYKVSYGDAFSISNLGGMHTLAVPIVRLNEFLSDTQQIGQNVIVGQTGWEQALENNKQAFTAEFVQRPRFTSTYQTSISPATFVNALFTNAGFAPTTDERLAAINEFGSATTIADAAARARAVRLVAENPTLKTLEFNRAFVLMQFFGYLRRNPNDPQDTDYTGYDFWLGKLNQFNGNFVNAEMVKAFITSTEYRQRFGP
jgi:hypothetical protein